MLHTVLPRLISMLLSWMDSANLRDRMYTLKHRVELLSTAIDDIQRINASDAHNRTELINSICTRLQND